MSPSSDPTTTTATTTPKHETAVVLPANLHARPAGQLARAAAGFTSAIQLEYADRTVNPTGVLAVMGLGATAGSTVTVRAEGHDAEQAVTALAQILAAAE
ncbi:MULTISPECIES: HPr family phosphocarrier protein [unclassified Streptomyces]|uniref:HPr family phosphocarrier protein n=1 Tax=unclassified Streptomyces TaxID=2593676 RepID=UPI00225548D5|nr:MULTISPECIES: HPr family phosphocarrier protein [unclassified Streptomyces]MCX4989515.1 HPr family phosphocarrier protein [Streptomyces sp. NBC_00568]MCX5005245.1 HPr family phosphocarrier protein [Streptomyces sp. NBC_00638]